EVHSWVSGPPAFCNFVKLAGRNRKCVRRVLYIASGIGQYRRQSGGNMKNIRSNILTRKTLEDALLSQNIVHEHEQYKHSLQEQFLPVLSILQLTLFGLLGWWV